jgi:broad specificity phosphatase PhoE
MSAERASRAFTVYLARHGRSVWNEEGRVAGQLEAPISDVGRAQADNLASVLDGVRLHAVYSSPLARARETAQPTAARQALNVCVRSELRELHFGVLQGRYRDHRDPETVCRAARAWPTWTTASRASCTMCSTCPGEASSSSGTAM